MASVFRPEVYVHIFYTVYFNMSNNSGLLAFLSPSSQQILDDGQRAQTGSFKKGQCDEAMGRKVNRNSRKKKIQSRNKTGINQKA